MTDVFIAMYDDNDYYCEGNHIIAVCSSRELADAAIERYKTLTKYTAQYVYEVAVTRVDHWYRYDPLYPNDSSLAVLL